MAGERPEEFAAYIGSRQSAELQREIRRQEKELAAMRKRKAELDAIFKKLYEDSVLSRITTEQFQMLSSSYTEEQNQIAAGIPQKEADIQRLRETVSGTDGFLDKAKRYMDITELTPELLRLFIEKIVVHEKEVKWSNTRPRPWRFTTTALVMSAAVNRIWKKRWKHRNSYKPRKQKSPGRHRKHDDLPGYPRNHLLPL